MNKKGEKIINLFCILAGVFIILTSTTPTVLSQQPQNQNTDENVYDQQYDLSHQENIEISLPYYLDGTILDGHSRVVITENGQLPFDISPIQYDFIISYAEMDLICDNARNNFIAQYNIDPYIEEPEDINLKSSFSPVFYSDLYTLKQQIADNSQIYSTADFSSIQEQFCSQQNILSTEINFLPDYVINPNTFDGPYQIDGQIWLQVHFPIDSLHRPTNLPRARDDVVAGFSSFTKFNVVPEYPIFYSGFWDASGVSENDVYQILDNLEQECSDFQTQHNVLVMGYVKRGNHNGIADLPGFYSVVAEHATTIDHPKANIVRHEISHNFNCAEGGWWPWNHGWKSCVMNYFYCLFGSGKWCNTCQNNIYNYMWR